MRGGNEIQTGRQNLWTTFSFVERLADWKKKAFGGKTDILVQSSRG